MNTPLYPCLVALVRRSPEAYRIFIQVLTAYKWEWLRWFSVLDAHHEAMMMEMMYGQPEPIVVPAGWMYKGSKEGGE